MSLALATWIAAGIGEFVTGSAIAYSTAAAIATVLQFIAITAASMAVSKLLAPKLPSLSDSSFSQRSQMVRSPVSARQVLYGRCKVSGTLLYISTTGTKNEYLHLIVALAGHEVEEIGDIYFNDELVPLSGSTPTGKYATVARINKHTGSSSQTADTDLISDTSSLTDGKWTTNHKLLGIAYVYVRLKWDTTIFVGGIPTISAILQGKKVYDPRTSTTVYSANPALCLRDYITDNAIGMGMTSSEVDDASIIAAANICEEQVQILPVSPATYENRYECNGVISTSASPDENIGKLISSMAGLIAYSGGKIVLYAAGYRIPTVSLNEKHFAGALNVSTKTSARDRVNSIKGVYISEDNAWQVSDFPSVTSSSYVSSDNGVVYWRDVTLPFTTSGSCAQRLAVIELRRARQEITFTAKFRLEAMQVRAGDTIQITNSKLGWTNKVFEVLSWNFSSDGSPPQLGVEMTLRETASSVYSWTVSDEVDVPVASKTTLPNPFTLAAPTNLSLTGDGTTQFIQSDGTAIPRILVTWTAPSEQFIQSGGAVLIEYKLSSSSTWITWSRVLGNVTSDYISSDIKIGSTYNIRISGESYFKVLTGYLSGTITVASDTTPPAVPTGLTSIVGSGKAVSLDWDDNTESDFERYGVYRYTSAITASSIKIAETASSRFVDVDVTIGTSYYYWISAYDRSDNQSNKCNYVTAVPTVIGSSTVDNTAPSTPSAPTFVSESTYLSSDGTAFSRITLALSSLPTGAVGQNLLYKNSSGTNYQIAGQLTASGNISIDDLTPTTAYVFAVQAYSFSGASSTISSTLSRTSPTYSGTPSTITAGQLAANAPPTFNTSTSKFLFGTQATWTPTTDKDFAYYVLKATYYNSSSDTTYTWYNGSGSAGIVQTTTPICNLYSATLTPGFVWIAVVNKSGNQGSWFGIGNANSYCSYGTGTIATQEQGSPALTGVSIGSIGASSVVPLNTVYTGFTILYGGNGNNYYAYTGFPISGRGFTVAPMYGNLTTNVPNVQISYNAAYSGQTSTFLTLDIQTTDGSAIPSGSSWLVNFQFIA
jgi:hypothetical protein